MRRANYNHRTSVSHLWQLVKGLSGTKPHNSPNKGVRFADKSYLDPKSNPNGSCLFATGSPTDTVGSPNFLTFSSNITSWRLMRRANNDNNLHPKKIANKFARQFTPPPIRLIGDKSKRQLKRQIYQLPLTGTPSLSPVETIVAIKLAKSSTVIGPDGMSTIHRKKLAYGAINYFTNIFNLSI